MCKLYYLNKPETKDLEPNCLTVSCIYPPNRTSLYLDPNTDLVK